MEVAINKVACICLVVRDMERLLKFYRNGLGWKTNFKENNPPVCFFNNPGTKFKPFHLKN